jgi:hypothetical protein
MTVKRVLLLYEASRRGVAIVDLARGLAESERLALTVVAMVPHAPTGSRCGNSAHDYNAALVDAVARDLDDVRARLGEAGEGASFEMLVDGTEPSLEEFATLGGFDLVLLPARRGLLRAPRHPAADGLRRATRATVQVVSDR